MPSGLESSAASVARSGLLRVVRIAGFAVVAAIALFCALLLLVRFVIYPRIESHHGDIAAIMSRELGHPVEIDAIRTGWDGWNPRLVVQGLRVRDRDNALTQPLIELPTVGGVVSWTSLLTAELRLKELTIERPRLRVRRDRAGNLHVAGFEFESAPHASDTQFTDWLLRQRIIVVRDALIAWNDELRQAPELLLDGVQFRLESRFGHHRFGLRGTPPAEVAAPIDVRGDLSANSLSDWRNASGRVYARLDYADMAAWSEWIPLPVRIERGEGAVRVWFEFADGVARDVFADIELADVRTKIADDLEPLDLAHLAGRLTWQQQGGQRTFAMRGLALAERDGARLAPTDLTLRYEVGADASPSSGRVTATRLELQALAALATQLPLPARAREEIARHAPQGTIVDAEYAWQGPPDAPSTFRASGGLAAVGMRDDGSLPGFSGLSGRFEATQAGGTLELASSRASLRMPRVFVEPVAIDRATGRVRWEHREGAWSVRVDDLKFENADVSGSAQGTWKSLARGPGEIDMTARVTRVDGRQVHRYLPRAVDSNVRSWLRESLVGGTSDDTRVTLKGDLARFPFADGKSGTFVITARARDATLAYAPGWPPVEGVDAELRFEGASMTITAANGRMLGATLDRTTASIADLSAWYPVLAVEGRATGPTSEFLRFIATSPVADWIGHYTDATTAAGNGKLALRIEWAIGNPDDVARVAGEYEFANNELRLPGVPPLAQVAGRLAFTERSVVGRDIAVETLGGAARVSVASEGGKLRIDANGNASLAAVHREFATPHGERFTGTTDWRFTLDDRHELAAWTLESSLKGVTVDLPRPLGKPPSEAMPLKVDRRGIAKDRDAIVVDYGGIARIVAHRKLPMSGASVERALVLLGKSTASPSEPERPGITIRGNASVLNADEWLALASAAGAQGTSSPASRLDVEAVDIEATEFIVLGRGYEDMKLSARHDANRWRFRFDSRQAQGVADWEPAGSKLANGRISAQLARLDFAAMRETKTAGEPARDARREGSANPWPELDVRAERFIGRAGNLGRLELAARPEATDWRVTRLALVNEAGRIDAEGTWRLVGRQQHTQLDVTIDVGNASGFLARFGLPGDVKGAAAKLQGQLGWPGSPTDFEYAKLSGKFRVNVGAGQFTKMDPGVGKLLGVLSLQALPRRITLDFRDVFSEGFAFDTIAGNVTIANGIMRTDDLLVSGPAAKVVLAGDVDLDRETQSLSVRVQPSLSTVVSTGAGAAAVALLAANPLVGAAVGAGTLLAQRIMQDPIEQIFSYEYAVRGSWSDPVVERSRSPVLQRLGEAQKGAAPTQ